MRTLFLKYTPKHTAWSRHSFTGVDEAELTEGFTSRTYYSYDLRGNVAERLYATGGSYEVDEYDGPGNRTEALYNYSDPWGFEAQAGYYTDLETGLILCTHRFYAPFLGRFITRDPIGYDGGINLYGYCQNDPVNGIDPDGTDDVDTAIMTTYTGLGIVFGGTLGAGGGGIAGFGVGAVPGAVAGAIVGAAAGAASGAVTVVWQKRSIWGCQASSQYSLTPAT